MPDPRGPRPADLRAMLRLCDALHRCDDPVAQKRRLLSGLCELLDAESAVSMVAHVERARHRPAIVSVTRHGPERVSEDQLLCRFLPALDRRATSGADHQFWRHLDWPRRPGHGARLHHCLWRPAPLSDAVLVACLSLARAPAIRQPFDRRQRLLLRLAHTELSWVYEADMFLASHGAPALSPRPRQTLQYLLSGHSEKQIAEIMRISPNTIHHYVKAIHKHFKVSSRSELLAKWLR